MTEVLSCKDCLQKELGFREGASDRRGREKEERKGEEWKKQGLAFPHMWYGSYVHSKKDLLSLKDML